MFRTILSSGTYLSELVIVDPAASGVMCSARRASRRVDTAPSKSFSLVSTLCRIVQLQSVHNMDARLSNFWNSRVEGIGTVISVVRVFISCDFLFVHLRHPLVHTFKILAFIQHDSWSSVHPPVKKCSSLQTILNDQRNTYHNELHLQRRHHKWLESTLRRLQFCACCAMCSWRLQKLQLRVSSTARVAASGIQHKSKGRTGSEGRVIEDANLKRLTLVCVRYVKQPFVLRRVQDLPGLCKQAEAHIHLVERGKNRWAKTPRAQQSVELTSTSRKSEIRSLPALGRIPDWSNSAMRQSISDSLQQVCSILV